MVLSSTVPVHIIKQESKQQKKVTLEIKGTSNIAYKKEVNVFIDDTIEDLIKAVEDIEEITKSKKAEKGKRRRMGRIMVSLLCHDLRGISIGRLLDRV